MWWPGVGQPSVNPLLGKNCWKGSLNRRITCQIGNEPHTAHKGWSSWEPKNSAICSVVGVGLSIGLLETHFFKKIKNEDNPAFSNGSLLNQGYKVKMTYQLHYLVEAPLYRHDPLAATKLWTCTPSIPSCLVERYLVNSKYFPTPSAGVDLYSYVDAAHAASKRKPERSHRNLPRPHER